MNTMTTFHTSERQLFKEHVLPTGNFSANHFPMTTFQWTLPNGRFWKQLFRTNSGDDGTPEGNDIGQSGQFLVRYSSRGQLSAPRWTVDCVFLLRRWSSLGVKHQLIQVILSTCVFMCVRNCVSHTKKCLFVRSSSCNYESYVLWFEQSLIWIPTHRFA